MRRSAQFWIRSIAQTVCTTFDFPKLQEDIEKVRTVDEQVGRMGVPEEWVDAGHAFHTYTLTSDDGSGERRQLLLFCLGFVQW